jgi:hypothetical protein
MRSKFIPIIISFNNNNRLCSDCKIAFKILAWAILIQEGFGLQNGTVFHLKKFAKFKLNNKKFIKTKKIIKIIIIKKTSNIKT